MKCVEKGERKACNLHAYSNVILSLEKSELLDERTVNDECKLRARRINASPELFTKRRKKRQ